MAGSRPRALLIDGYNLLHAIPRFAPRGGPLAPAREKLERWLAAAARRRGSPEVVVVWDGRDRARAAGAPHPLEVLYTAGDVSADERILELCRGRFAGRADGTWVVSSDREIQHAARQLGFTVLGAMTFYRKWAEGSGSGRRGQDPAPRVRGSTDKPLHASRAEVEDLLGSLLRARGEADEADAG